MKLNDTAIYISRGISPAYDNDGVVVLNQKCIRDFKIDLGPSRVTNPVKKRIAEDKYVKIYDVLVNSTGVGTLGRVAQVKILEGPMTVDSHVTIVRPNLDYFDPYYFGYAMCNNQSQIERMGDGATGQTELSKTRLSNEINLGIPAKEKQKRIGKILSAYDELIDNNLVRIDNLEKMARLLYRKATTEKKLIETELSEVADARRGISWDRSQETYTDGIKVLTIPNVQRHISLKGATSLTGISINHCENYSVIKDDILMIGSNGNPKRVGSVARYGNNDKVLFASFLMRIRADKSKISPKLLYLMLNDPLVVAPLRSGAIGSVTLRNIRITALRSLKLSIPSGKDMENLEGSLSPIFDLVESLRQKNEILVQTRNMLLPQLMSGEVEV